MPDPTASANQPEISRGLAGDRVKAETVLWQLKSQNCKLPYNECGACLDLIASALSAARAEEREKCALFIERGLFAGRGELAAAIRSGGGR